MRHSVPLVLPIALLLATTAAAKDTSYNASVHVVPSSTGADMARGTVFVDANRNGILDDAEIGIAGVLVSNGREVVTTDDVGSYALPV